MNMRKALCKQAMALVLFLLPLTMMAQGTIQGVITDETEVPVPGASVVVKGTTNGTISDFDGNYTITVDNFPATLVFSSLGYATKEVRVTGASTLNMILA